MESSFLAINSRAITGYAIVILNILRKINLSQLDLSACICSGLHRGEGHCVENTAQQGEAILSSECLCYLGGQQEGGRVQRQVKTCVQLLGHTKYKLGRGPKPNCTNPHKLWHIHSYNWLLKIFIIFKILS